MTRSLELTLAGPGFVGGFTDGFLPTETATRLCFAPAHYTPTNMPRCTSDYVFNTITGYPSLYPTAFPAGQYDLRGLHVRLHSGQELPSVRIARTGC